MKISLRILLINFIIVVLVFGSSIIAFYSVTRNIISSQQSESMMNSYKDFLVIIGITGITLSLILSLVFTEKIRKQITHLSKAADITRSGNLKHRISMLTKDELGRLGLAFNSMLDEIERNQNAKNEYSEFITLINQNPSLEQLSEAALIKIIKATGFTAGRMFLAEGREVRPVSSYGLQNDPMLPGSRIDLYQRVIEKNETVEFNFTENYPKLHTGIMSLDIKYLLIYPVIYNKKVIAILELAAISNLKDGAREYLENIHHQLAIGLSNASAFRQLKNLVGELKELNDDYQKQNEQIKYQNATLIELHKELKEKAEELELQREKALDAAMHKSQFLATMSHELKTPLNSVLGLTELVINDRNTGSANKEKLEIVLRNGNRLMNLINDILNFSKLEAGKMELQTESFRLSELISDIDQQIMPLFKNKDISFTIINEVKTDNAIVSDKFKINQILINLLSNAVKFTENGYIRLKIEYIEETRLKFEVIDTGIGISPKGRDQIFEEFRQIDGSSKRKYNGTGLGLAISRRYAELLNGSLDYESEPGKGSVFSLIVPVEFSEESENSSSLQGLIQSDNKESENSELKTVLVIDDNAGHHSMIKDYLASKNYSVIEAIDSKEGMEKAIEIKPFLIVLNILLEDENSWRLLKELKENKDTKEIPVVLITIMDELNTGYGLQVYDYILKPLNTDLFHQMITKLENSVNGRIQNLVYVGNDEPEINKLYETCDKDYKFEFVNDTALAFKSISRLHPGLVLIDLSMPKSDGISLVKKLKDSVETKDIPLILCFSDEQIEQESHLLRNSIEKAAIKSKGNPIDVLKVIKDRIHLEEGLPREDTSTLWLETKPEGFFVGAEPPSNINDNKFAKIKVLVVDDDNDTLFTVGEIVRQTGCETVFAKNGVECLSVLQQYTPDLVLLDIMMPQMDGFETIKRIRADKNISDVTVFALTALAMMDEKEILIKNGFNDFIPKPVNSSILISKLEKLLINA